MRSKHRRERGMEANGEQFHTSRVTGSDRFKKEKSKRGKIV